MVSDSSQSEIIPDTERAVIDPARLNKKPNVEQSAISKARTRIHSLYQSRVFLLLRGNEKKVKEAGKQEGRKMKLTGRVEGPEI